MAPTTESVYFPSEIWDQIISKLGDERHLEPLSLVSKSLLSITNRHKQTLNLSDQTAHFLPSLFGRFPNLKHISFSEFTDDPVPVLRQMADSNFRIETLDLSNHEGFPIEAFEELPASALSGLKSFKRPSRDLGDDDLEDIVRFFPNVEELDLSNLSYGYLRRRRRMRYHRSSSSSRYGSGITDNGILRFGSRLKSLRKIDLSRHRLNDNRVVSLSENCPNLEEIVLKKCTNVSHNGIISVLWGCEKLKAFALSGNDIRAAEGILWQLGGCRNLSEIDCSEMAISDDLLKAMAKAKLPLKKVTFERCKGFTHGDGFRLFFATCRSTLDHLALVEFESLTDSSIRVLATCLGRLRYVNLSKCGALSDSSFFTLIKRCPLLETVEMENTNLGRKGFEESNIEVFKHQKIRTLNVCKNKNLRDGSLEKIATACPSLESLNLSSCAKISDECVGRIMRSCCLIKHLRIHGCSRLRNLDLDMNTYKLELLGATKSGLNDRGLTDIAQKCPDLMFLELSGCKWVTSEGVLEVVDKCTKLKEIDLLGCDNMSATMLPWMIAYRPSLRKIVPHEICSKIDGDQFWRRGCYVESEDFYRHRD